MAHLLDRALPVLEISLNRLLGHDDVARERLRILSKPLNIHFSDLGWGFALWPVEQGVQVLAPVDDATTCSTTLVGAGRLLTGADPRVDPGVMRIDGDAEYAAELLGILRQLRFDPVVELSPFLGPVASAQAAEGLRSLASLGRDLVRGMLDEGMRRTVRDVGGLPTGADVEAWMNEVDDLVMGVDRLEARLARLENPEV